MVPFSHITSLYAAATALELATFFVLAIVCVLQFCFVQRHGDAARTWVKWARYSLALYTFTMFVLCADSLIQTVYNRFIDRHIDFFDAERRGLIQARGFLDSIWWLFEAAVRALLLVTLAALGAGLAMARHSSSSTASAPGGWTRMPLLAGAAGGLTLLLAVALFGVRCYFWAHYFDGQAEQQGLVDSQQSQAGIEVDLIKINRVTIDMDLALNCIWLVLSLIVLGLAVRTRALSRSAPHTKTSSNYFLACAILFVAQPLYNMLILVIFYLDHSYSVPGGLATIVTDVVFRVWTYASILLALFVLGRKKIGGVWSTQQPFQTKDAAAGETVYQTPWGYSVTHQTAAPQQVAVQDSQAQLNNYYAQPQAASQQAAPVQDSQAQLNSYYAQPQPQQGAQNMQHQYQQNQHQHNQYMQQGQYQQQQQPHCG